MICCWPVTVTSVAAWPMVNCTGRLRICETASVISCRRDGGEAGGGNLHRVDARIEIRNAVKPLAVGLGIAGLVGGGVSRLHGGVGHGGAAWIGDRRRLMWRALVPRVPPKANIVMQANVG